MIRDGDCLATALAAILDVDARDLPWTGDPDWDAAWTNIRAALAERGWRLAHSDWSNETTTVASLLAFYETVTDEIELAMQWLVSITHPSWVRDGVQTGHVLVLRGAEILFDPSWQLIDQRPPLDELNVTGSYMLSPLDPSVFVHVAALQGYPIITLPSEPRRRGGRPPKRDGSGIPVGDFGDPPLL